MSDQAIPIKTISFASVLCAGIIAAHIYAAVNMGPILNSLGHELQDNTLSVKLYGILIGLSPVGIAIVILSFAALITGIALMNIIYKRSLNKSLYILPTICILSFIVVVILLAYGFSTPTSSS